MEDGLNGIPSEVEAFDPVTNGLASPIMAGSPEGPQAADTKEEDTPKLNGDASLEELSNRDEYSSESDALVIDESTAPRKRRPSARPKSPTTSDNGVTELPKPNSELVPHHYNPYFNESLFELSQQHNRPQDSRPEPETRPQSGPVAKFHKHKRPKNKNSPKLREYAQYLGLQPTVQFKCSRCGRAGFESLTTLNEHIVQCTDEPLTQPQVSNTPSSSFKLTRKVFLCSACGTYYENWNLYLHMVEVHRRYLCLYCLGMFSVLDDLCAHIQSRHNLEPGHKDTPEDFFRTYSDPCYIVCCDCGKVFSEQDNFFYHTCARREQVSKPSKTLNNQRVGGKSAKPARQLIRPENHVTGDSFNDVSAASGGPAAAVVTDPDSRTVSQETAGQDKETVTVNSTAEEKPIDTSYSSDSELEDFRGYNSDGQPVHVEKINYEKVDEEEVNDDEAEELLDNMEEPIDVDDQADNDEAFDAEQADSDDNAYPEEQDEEEEEEYDDEEEEPVETRKVPKLSLKLKPGSFPEIEQYNISDDSDKIQNDVEQIESENELNNTSNNGEAVAEDQQMEESEISDEPEMKVAGADVSIVELELEHPLDKFDVRLLLQKCLKATASTCIYCNHARKIAVNGKQLALHAIAEHRFSAVVSSITAEELIPESFVSKLKEHLPSLDDVFFSLECSPSTDEGITFSHVFECFQCRYVTNVHKELYLHNRKSHAKNLLLCIMCKSNFYSYSELICHLCPGVYILDYDVQFRCCMCVGDDLPSAFRLMVHLRKRHHVCDVCLEMCHSQYKLSSHVWKHKLHHFCYRCGIAYRNKPDITRHLFWKHGTESVLCKKCLQKKWPHMYHFCVPPTSFTCDECNLLFTRAVSLKVHKRIHSDEKPHACTIEDCNDKFISKKLLAKHELKHSEPPEEEPVEVVDEVKEIPPKEEDTEANKDKPEEKVKPKVDVYDLPELNLSESDSSDSEEEAKKEAAQPQPPTIDSAAEVEGVEEALVDNVLDFANDAPGIESGNNQVILEDIWDNFKNYQASKEKFDNLLTEAEKTEPDAMDVAHEEPLTLEMALRDHDYCVDPNNKPDVTFTEVMPDLSQSQSVDHDYCSAKEPAASKEQEAEKEPEEAAKNTKKATSSSSDSSSDSGSSSCSCGPNCSCSSTSGSSSSSSDSSDSDSSTEEGRKRQQIRRDRKKQRSKKGKGGENKMVDVVTTDNKPPLIADTPIEESDLETTESETDEEFYDKQPQKLAKQLLEEKRKLLMMAGAEPTPNGSLLETSRTATPNLPDEEPSELKPKKKSKSKKKKKRKSERKELEQKDYNQADIPNSQYYQLMSYYQQPPTVAPITLARNSPVPSPSAVRPPLAGSLYQAEPESSRDDGESNLRASKRRRVPNKFYGYSSDEEEATASKWRKSEAQATPSQHSSMMVVPPLTIKTVPSPAPLAQPKIQPFSIRATSHPGQMKVQPPRRMPPIRFKPPKPPPVGDAESEEEDEEEESNDSSNEGRNMLQVDPDALYCYCKCPYDEVSEMIGCDARDCAIEWFHFECVGIMVPPKGHWYCPECRKKRQQKREMLKMKAKAAIT